MIELRELGCRYGARWTVRNVSLRVETGQTMVLLGPSGCGKTTTLRMINRLVEPSEGEVLINGKRTSESRPEELRRGIGYVIQQGGLFPHWTVEENIATVPQLLGWSRQRRRRRAEELLPLVRLSGEYLVRFPGELSGGEKQRVVLARALAADPPIVLLDEPFGALDPERRAEIHQDFLQLEGLVRKTMILVTHDIVEALALGDVICLLADGWVQQVGPPSELLFRPANGIVRRFFDRDRFQHELMAVTVGDAENTGDWSAELSRRWKLEPGLQIRQALTCLRGEGGLSDSGRLLLAFNRVVERLSADVREG